MILVAVALMINGIPLAILNLDNELEEQNEAAIESWLPSIMINQYLLALGEF